MVKITGDYEEILSKTIYGKDLSKFYTQKEIEILESIIIRSDLSATKKIIAEKIKQKYNSKEFPLCIIPIIFSSKIFAPQLFVYQMIKDLLKNDMKCAVIYLDRFGPENLGEQLNRDTIIELHYACLEALDIVPNKDIQILFESILFDSYYGSIKWRDLLLDFDINSFNRQADRIKESPNFTDYLPEQEKKKVTISSLYSIFTILLFSAWPKDNNKKPAFIIIGMDKYFLFENLIKYLISKPNYSQEFQTDMIYIPNMTIYYDIKKRGNTIPCSSDSNRIIREVFETCSPDQLQKLCNLHQLPKKGDLSRDELAFELSNYFTEIFTNIEKIRDKNKENDFKSDYVVNSIEKFDAIINALKTKTSWQVLREIYKFSLNEKDLMKCIPMEISKAIKKHLTTVLPRFQDLKEAGLIIEHEGQKRGRGGNYYTLSFDNLIIKIDKQKLLGVTDDN